MSLYESSLLFLSLLINICFQPSRHPAVLEVTDAALSGVVKGRATVSESDTYSPTPVAAYRPTWSRNIDVTFSEHSRVMVQFSEVR